MTSTSRSTIWKPEYSVGIPSIDQQHKNLIDLIGNLEEAMSSGHGRDVLNRTFSELIRYTRVHFAYEEQVMKQTAYRDLVAHKWEHDKLTAEVAKLDGELQSGKIAMSVQVLQFLNNWLTKHIMGTDHLYCQHMSKNGVV